MWRGLKVFASKSNFQAMWAHTGNPVWALFLLNDSDSEMTKQRMHKYLSGQEDKKGA